MQVLLSELTPVRLKQADLNRAKSQDAAEVLQELVSQVPGIRGSGKDAYVPIE